MGNQLSQAPPSEEASKDARKERPRTLSMSSSERRGSTPMERFEGAGFHASYELNRPVPPPNGIKGTFISPFVSQGRAKQGLNEGKTFRIKCVRKSGLSARQEQRLNEEAYMLRFLSHPNILKVHQVFRYEPDFYFMVMTPARGGEVFDFLVRKVRPYLASLAFFHPTPTPYRVTIFADHDDDDDANADAEVRCIMQ